MIINKRENMIMIIKHDLASNLVHKKEKKKRK